MPRPWTQRFKRTGDFIKHYIEEHRTASAAEIHQAYSDSIREENTRRQQHGDRQLLTKPTYHSIHTYCRILTKLELLEPAGEEPMQFPRGDPAALAFIDLTAGELRVTHGGIRRLLRLTPKGQAETEAWHNPWRALYG